MNFSGIFIVGYFALLPPSPCVYVYLVLFSSLLFFYFPFILLLLCLSLLLPHLQYYTV